MKIVKKIELVKKIHDTLTNQFDEQDKYFFFNSFNLPILTDMDYNGNEYIDIKATLYQADDFVLKDIAEELNLSTEHIIITPPKNWERCKNIKAFISHLSTTKDIAKRLRDELKNFNIDCFVAHEDIYPTVEWEEQINRALQTMDFFISLHCEGFSNSVWCQQEVGYALARGVKIIPLKFDGKENPTGFIGKYQGLSRLKKTGREVAQEIVDIVKNDKGLKNLYEHIIKETELDEEAIPF
ncbi:TPA: hypothetical protein CPT98_09695 [Candidatus Gastranaerophilales bacterium HUM_19]|nr:MAG TPA: hypothetical protein CPT98_09695 [Candidatus Gastranaerophilales bacterium HUM_19]DAB25461.1 MAG TPA: hypothetical protein CPT86_06110 [Candidatus Gastranaerophilales bacterium HUM_23]